MGLLRVVRIEGHAFDHETIGKEEDRHIVENLEAFDAWSDGLKSFLLCDEVKLFNTSLQDFSVDLTMDIRAVRGSLKLQLFFDGISIELTLALTSVATDPLETVIRAELLHAHAASV